MAINGEEQGRTKGWQKKRVKKEEEKRGYRVGYHSAKKENKKRIKERLAFLFKRRELGAWFLVLGPLRKKVLTFFGFFFFGCPSLGKGKRNRKV